MQGVCLGWIFWVPAAIHCGYENPGCAQSEKPRACSALQPECCCLSASCQYLTSLSSWIISPVLNPTPLIQTKWVCFQGSFLVMYRQLIKVVCLAWKVSSWMHFHVQVMQLPNQCTRETTTVNKQPWFLCSTATPTENKGFVRFSAFLDHSWPQNENITRSNRKNSNIHTLFNKLV